jgi:hypothetical protein
MRATVAGTLVAGVLVLAASRADAGELSALFDLSVRVGERGITLDGRVGRPPGQTSGSISGRARDGGVVFDGWLDDRGRTWLFEFDANPRDGLRAVVRRAPLGI